MNNTMAELTRMGRRRFVKSLASLGVSGAALEHMTKEALAETNPDLDNEVPLLYGMVHTNPDAVRAGAPPKRKPSYFTVSRDEWAVIDSARDAEQQIRGLEVVQKTGVTVGVSTITRDHQQQKAVVLKYPIEEYPWGGSFRPDVSFETLTDRLPATVTGIAGRGTDSATPVADIPVVIERTRPKLMFKYNDRYRPVPAGSQWTTEAGNLCTIGTPVYDYDANEYRLVTAAHCFINHGSYAHQPNTNGDSTIGAKTSKIDFDRDPLFDAAVVNVYHGNADTTHQYATNGGSYRLGIRGSLSEDRLRYMENNGRDLHKQGIRTGVTSGPVTYVSNKTFHVDTNFGGGDSGCPFYEKIYDNNLDIYTSLIAGVLRGGGSVAQVTQIENVENRWSVAV